MSAARRRNARHYWTVTDAAGTGSPAMAAAGRVTLADALDLTALGARSDQLLTSGLPDLHLPLACPWRTSGSRSSSAPPVTRRNRGYAYLEHVDDIYAIRLAYGFDTSASPPPCAALVTVVPSGT